MTIVEKNIMRPRAIRPRKQKEFDERVIEVARVSRVAKGGRRIRFRVLVVIGDLKGRIGMGVAKANEVSAAVKKATVQAKKHLVNVPIIDGTIPYEVYVKHGGSKILLKPASSGTSIVAGGSVRSIAELAGITDLLAKSIGSSSKINNVTATIKALTSFNQDIVEKIRKLSERKKVPMVQSKTEDIELQHENVGKRIEKKNIKTKKATQDKSEKLKGKNKEKEPIKKPVKK